MLSLRPAIVIVSAWISVGCIQAQAANFQWSRGIETGAEYLSDETGQAEEDTSSTESRVTVTPYVGVSATGRRANFNLDARLLAISSSESDDSDIRPRIAATSSVFSTNNRLQFDLAASIQQRNVNSPFLDDGTLFDSSSPERVLTLSAGPRYQQSFDRTVIGAFYNAGTTSSSETDDTTSVAQAIAIEVIRILPSPQWLIGTRIDAQHTAFESAPSILSQSVRLFTGYQFRNNLQGRITVGRDANDVENALNETDDSLWGAGFYWRIGRRVTVDASYVERSFGRQPNVSIAFNGRRSSVDISWTRNLGISALADGVQFGLDNLPNSTDADSGNGSGQTPDTNSGSISVDTTGSLLIPLFQESRNINEVVTVGYTLRGRTTVFNASVSSIQQENLVSAEGSESTLFEVGLTRTVSRASSVSARVVLGESEQFGADTDARIQGKSGRVSIQWGFQF